MFDVETANIAWKRLENFEVHFRGPVGSIEGPSQVLDAMRVHLSVPRVPRYVFCCLECNKYGQFPSVGIFGPPWLIRFWAYPYFSLYYQPGWFLLKKKSLPSLAWPLPLLCISIYNIIYTVVCQHCTLYTENVNVHLLLSSWSQISPCIHKFWEQF